jgi:hypothetical protein
MSDREEIRNANRETERNLAAFLAVDLPDPVEYAQCLAVVAPELAAIIMTASWRPGGWRIALPANDPALRAMRSLGLVEVRGFEPSSENIAAGLGTHLGCFGREVMVALYAIKALDEEERNAAE